MRLADVVLRRGHLSDDALVEVWTTGVRPVHLDRCDLCAERAVEMSRWLEDVRVLGRADADTMFPEVRLAAQRGHVMQRLAQLDRPAKVISFPAARPALHDLQSPHRVSRGWLAAAAAAGLMVGVVSVELTHLWPFDFVGTTQSVTAPASAAFSAEDVQFLDAMLDRPSLGALRALDEMTPRVADVVLVSNR